MADSHVQPPPIGPEKPMWKRGWVVLIASSFVTAIVGSLTTVFVSHLLNSGGHESKSIEKQNETATNETKVKSLPASLQQGLVAYYSFNGNSQDESGNGHHITERQVTIVKEGRAVIGEGGSFEVTIPELPSANMPRTLALTLVPRDRALKARMVCYWGTPGALSCFGVSYVKGDAYRWLAYPTDGKVACALSQETHLVLVCDGVMVKFYKNGLLVNDEELTLKTAAGDRFYIGSKTNSHSEFEGSLDDIRIYDRALSAAEVKTLYEYEKP